MANVDGDADDKGSEGPGVVPFRSEHENDKAEQESTKSLESDC